MSRRVLGRIGMVVLSTLVALGVAELIYRGIEASSDAPDGGDWRSRYRNMNETIYRRSANAELVYEPVPGASVEMEYGPAGFNAASMRDDRSFSVTPGERHRVAILGDSIVWSELLALHDSIPRRAEEALGDAYEVLAFGVSGYDVTQEAAFYETAVRPYRPATVVLVWCMNDVMIMSGPFERFANEDDRARKDAQEALIERVAPVRRETIDGIVAERERDAPLRLLSRAFGIVERRRFDTDYIDEYLVMFAQTSTQDRIRTALARLGRALTDEGATAILVISPVLEAWSSYHWDPIHAFVSEVARDVGFVVVDPLEAWRRQVNVDEMHIGGDNLHYDGSGARVMGRVIADAVVADRNAD